MPLLAARFAAIDVETALIHGEMVALRPDGTSHFHDLQAAPSVGADGGLFFYAFDLLHLDGWDLLACALRNRKRLLEALKGWNNAIRYAAHVEGNAAGLLKDAARLKLEGIIGKRANALYRAGRSVDWLKVSASDGRTSSCSTGRRLMAPAAASAPSPSASTTRTGTCSTPARSAPASPARSYWRCTPSSKTCISATGVARTELHGLEAQCVEG